MWPHMNFTNIRNLSTTLAGAKCQKIIKMIELFSTIENGEKIVRELNVGVKKK